MAFFLKGKTDNEQITYMCLTKLIIYLINQINQFINHFARGSAVKEQCNIGCFKGGGRDLGGN